MAFCDGKTAVLVIAAQGHKCALDGDDLGLNTGGMGAYAPPAPCGTPDLQDEEIEAMMYIKTVEKMAEKGTPYVGVLCMLIWYDDAYINWSFNH